MNRPPAGQDGIGLIEFLVSLLILTIMITGTMALQLTSLRTTTESRTSTLATTLAQSRLEELRSGATAGACAAGNTVACLDYEGSPTAMPVEQPAGTACTAAYYTRTTTITSSGVASGACDIQVTVRWTGATGPMNVIQTLTRTP